MPLDNGLIKTISDYCKRDLPGDLDWHVKQFSFIGDNELEKRLGRAFYTARTIAKLMEALGVNKDDAHPFVKFQIMQYASIYEAVISYLLWNKFSTHPDVIKLETHKTYKKVSALGSLTKVMYEDEEVYTCVYRNEKTQRNSISFPDKVDCAVRIGFVSGKYSEDIKDIYKLRNLAHIETEAQKDIEVEIENSKKGYWRIQPFIEGIKDFLENN